MVTQFPLEYMHLVLLGAMKRILKYWVDNKFANLKSKNNMLLFDKNLLYCNQFLSSDFNRKHQSVTNFSKWKATELRTFLLYTGPFVLRDILPPEHFENFLHLHLGIRILCNTSFILNEDNITFAQTLINTFVQNSNKLYKNFVVYNIHTLLHISEDVINFGSLDQYSAFAFENFMKTIKNYLKKNSLSLQQVINRVHENEFIDACISDQIFEAISFPRFFNPKDDNKFKILKFKDFKLTLKRPDNICVNEKNTFIYITSFFKRDNVDYFLGHQFENLKVFHTFANREDLIDIFISDEKSSLEEEWPVSSIKGKALCITESDSTFYLVKLLHPQIFED